MVRRDSLGRAAALERVRACLLLESPYYTKHARTRMADRGLSEGDVEGVLQAGHVLDDPRPSATGPGWQYRVTGPLPGGGRTMTVVVEPMPDDVLVVITVMWNDGS